MTTYAHIQKPDLDYQYEFGMDELDALESCLTKHGFAIIKDLLPSSLIDQLKEAVYAGTDPDRTLQRGESRTRHAWIESGLGAWSIIMAHFLTN